MFAHKNKLSIETAARELRVEALLDIARANNCNKIVTAHQKNDNAETILQRLSRGTGFRGLGGIWPLRVFDDEFKFVRPLLCVRRDEIIDYLKERGLKWQTDHTNEDCMYRRNYIRHRLIPALQADSTGSIVEQLSELAQLARRFHSLVCGCAEKVWPGLADCAGESLKLDLKIFLAQHPAVKVELVRRGLVALGSGERNLTQGHFKKILQLAEQNVGGRKLELPDGFVAWREYGKLFFAHSEKKELKKGTNQRVELNIPGRTGFGNYLIAASFLEAKDCDVNEFRAEKSSVIEWFDWDKVNLPLVVRFREAGDRFVPLGLASEKRVGKFLTAAKVPQRIREKTLIATDNEKIIWVWPIRISEQAKITSRTQKVLQLQITDADLAR